MLRLLVTVQVAHNDGETQLTSNTLEELGITPCYNNGKDQTSAPTEPVEEDK